MINPCHNIREFCREIAPITLAGQVIGILSGYAITTLKLSSSLNPLAFAVSAAAYQAFHTAFYSICVIRLRIAVDQATVIAGVTSAIAAAGVYALISVLSFPELLALNIGIATVLGVYKLGYETLVVSIFDSKSICFCGTDSECKGASYYRRD